MQCLRLCIYFQDKLPRTVLPSIVAPPTWIARCCSQSTAGTSATCDLSGRVPCVQGPVPKCAHWFSRTRHSLSCGCAGETATQQCGTAAMAALQHSLKNTVVIDTGSGCVARTLRCVGHNVVVS